MSFENHSNYNCEIETESGQTYKIYSSWIHNNKLDSWHGWHCLAGATRVYIDKDLKVYGGECRNDYLGSALDNFQPLDHTICKQVSCSGCTDDLITPKHRL